VRGVLFAAVLLGSTAGLADEPFWREVVDPDLRTFREEIATGRSLLPDSEDEGDLGKLVRMGEALAHFDRAVAIRPDDPVGHLLRARALRELAESPVLRTKNREAIAALRRARELDRDREFEEDVAFDLGIALTVEGDFDGALAEYDRGLALCVSPDSRSINLSNAAEVLMNRGRVREAIERYEAAIAEARLDGIRSLAEYGLAVALDRDDQRGRALEVMRDGWNHDPNRADPNRLCGTLTNPGDSGVFFVPAHDHHYYVALQLEARAAVEADEAIRQRLAETSANEWQEFLSSGGAAGPWARQAREHAAAIDHRRVGRPRRGTGRRGR